MPNPDKTPGQKLVEEWITEQNADSFDDRRKLAYDVLSFRIDRLLAELTHKRVLDLTGVFTFPKSGPKTGDYYLSENGVRDAIRQQFPDVEVKT